MKAKRTVVGSEKLLKRKLEDLWRARQERLKQAKAENVQAMLKGRMKIGRR